MQSSVRYLGSLTIFRSGLLLFLFFAAVGLLTGTAAWGQDASTSPSAEQSRLTAGMDSVMARKLFEIGASSDEITQLGQGGESFLVRFRQPPGALSTAVLVLVENDANLLADNLATSLLQEFSINNWPVLLMSLAVENSVQSSVESEHKSYAAKIAEAVSYLKSNQVESVVMVASENTEHVAVQAAIDYADTINVMILEGAELSDMPNAETMSLLQKSHVSILDIVINEFDKTALQQRKQWFIKNGFQKGYRLISAPEARAGDQYIVKRARAWLERGFSQ